MGNSFSRFHHIHGGLNTDQHTLRHASLSPAREQDGYQKDVEPQAAVQLIPQTAVGSPNHRTQKTVRRLCKRLTSIFPGTSVDVGSVDCDAVKQTAVWRVCLASDFKHAEHKLNTMRWQSPSFTLGMAGGSQLCWRLLVLCDHHTDAMSCYLESLSARSGEHDSLYMCEYTMEARLSGDAADCDLATTRHKLQHVFSSTEPAWGVINLVQIGNLQRLPSHTYEVQVLLHNLQKLAAEPHEDVEDLPYDVLQLCTAPKVLLIDNFLEPELCDYMRKVALPRLVRSKVSAGTETPSRTSCSTFFTGENAKDPVIVEMEQRIEQLVNHPSIISGHKPLLKTEAMQVVRYVEGEFYAEHYDNKAGGAISRAATIIIYLCPSDGGGSTFFPRASPPLHLMDALPPGVTYHQPSRGGPREEVTSSGSSAVPAEADGCCTPGLRIYPAMGRAILFWSKLPNGREDLCSIHAGEKVLRGEKWIATRWLKEAE